MNKFLVRSLSATLLMQLNSTPVRELLRTPPTTTNPCSTNANIYTQADVISARSELELRRNHLKRIQTLVEQGVLPRTELDEAVYQERVASIKLKLAETAVSPAMAQLSQAQAELDLRRIELQRMQVLASQGAISRSELAEAVQKEKNARAKLEKARVCLREQLR